VTSLEHGDEHDIKGSRRKSDTKHQSGVKARSVINLLQHENSPFLLGEIQRPVMRFKQLISF
jgi:hypothetical protein